MSVHFRKWRSGYTNNPSTGRPALLPTGCLIEAYEPGGIAVPDPSNPACLPTTRPPAPLPDSTFRPMVLPYLLPPGKNQLLVLLRQYFYLFHIGASPLGVARYTEHSITTGDAPPLRQRPYRVSGSKREVTENEVDQMLPKDIIRPTSGPWASPVVLTPRKTEAYFFA